MKDICVYTAITGGRDKLKINQNWGEKADWICFTDGKIDKGGNWKYLPAYDKFKCNNRNAKIHKVLSHLYVGDHKYSLWIDASMTLKTKPEDLLKKWLIEPGADVALYMHPERKSIYEEAKLLWSVPRHRWDNPEILEQMECYKDNKIEGTPLFSCAVLFRRNNGRVVKMNQVWWEQICRWSRRDQLSFTVAAGECSYVCWNGIDDEPRKYKSRESEDFVFTCHPKRVKDAKKKGIPILKRMEE